MHLPLIKILNNNNNNNVETNMLQINTESEKKIRFLCNHEINVKLIGRLKL